MPTRVALYTRVSTEDQAKEGFSLDAQLERLRYYAKAQGWTVAGEYIDEGHSGRTTKRPQYTRMMAEIEGWDTLLVLKMDRIHRNSRNFMAMMDHLRKKGREFASVTESLDTSTAMGRFVMDIIQRIAQLESDQIGERTFTGMEEKARQGGGSLGKPAPFGYRYLEGTLAPVSTEAPIVAELFRRFAAGASKQDLASWLNAQGLRGRRTGAAWTYRSVDNVLRNPSYAGALGWEGRLQRRSHPAIVDEALFEAVQARIRETSPKARTYTLQAAPESA
ncbi:MAG: recombinase family protein [Thermoplasmatota archaeon]